MERSRRGYLALAGERDEFKRFWFPFVNSDDQPIARNKAMDACRDAINWYILCITGDDARVAAMKDG